MALTSSPRALLVLAAGSAASVGAGALTIAASWVPWADSCGSGLDGPACVNAQDHRSDVLATGNPWEPIGSSAVRAGLGHVLLAVGLAPVFTVLPSPIWTRAIRAMLVGSVLGLGVITLLSLRVGESIGFEWLGIPRWLSPVLLPIVLVGGWRRT